MSKNRTGRTAGIVKRGRPPAAPDISLHPLTADVALAAFMRVDPKKGASKKRKPRQGK